MFNRILHYILYRHNIPLYLLDTLYNIRINFDKRWKICEEENWTRNGTKSEQVGKFALGIDWS